VKVFGVCVVVTLLTSEATWTFPEQVMLYLIAVILFGLHEEQRKSKTAIELLDYFTGCPFTIDHATNM